MVTTRRRSIATTAVASADAPASGSVHTEASPLPGRQPVFEGVRLDSKGLTVGTLRKALMAEAPWVFERSLVKSGAYLLADLVAIAALFWASTFIDPSPLHPVLKAAAWLLYWFFQARIWGRPRLTGGASGPMRPCASAVDAAAGPQACPHG